VDIYVYKLWITCRGEWEKNLQNGAERIEEVVDNLWISREETVVQKPHR
jgi:hypothetical protein